MKRFLPVIENPGYYKMQFVPGVTFPKKHIILFSILQKIFIVILLLYSLNLQAQQNSDAKQTEYRNVINQRASKIINTLEIADSARYKKVLAEVVNQYFQLNTIHEQSKATISEIKKQEVAKEKIDEMVKKEQENKSLQLKQLHESFIAHLKESLADEQIEKIKDAMTYRVFPITYAAYQDMLPGLTSEQKNKIYSWLKEARELAMDAESSEKKHEVFGKYKGRINNYLSAAGYDMKKEGEAWQKRIKEKEEKKKNSQG
jgi:uncharacterized protein DUF3826